MSAEKKATDRGAIPLLMDDRIPVRGNVLVHEVTATDETVIFARNGGELLLLNDTGAGVYYLIDGRRTVAEIAALVRESFPDATSADDDVVTFLATLERVGALHFA